MPTYHKGMVYEDVARAHLAFRDVIRQAEVLDRRTNGGRRSGTTQVLILAYGEFTRELRDVEMRTAAEVTRKMREILGQSRRRPDSGLKPQSQRLRGSAIARPLNLVAGVPTGSVGVGDIERLNRVVNPLAPGAGSYWRAQEYGSTHNVGRRIHGYFFDAGLGNPTRPATGFTGTRNAQPIFVPAKVARELGAEVGIVTGGGSRGGSGGAGVIRNPIPAKGFISGAILATTATWNAELAAAEANAMNKIRNGLALAAHDSRRRRTRSPGSSRFRS